MKKNIISVISLLCMWTVAINTYAAEVCLWYYKDGVPVNSDSKGNISARVAINDAEEGKQYSLFLASYNGDGKLHDVLLTKSSGNGMFEISAPDNSDGGTVKAFAWDSMRPLEERKFYIEDFENDKDEKPPSYNKWSITAPEGTEAVVAEDPKNSANKVLKLSDNTTSGRLSAIYHLSEQANDVYSVSWRIYYARDGAYKSGENDTGYSWFHARTAKNETIMSMAMLDNSSGNGNVMTKAQDGEVKNFKNITVNEWHDMAMVYYGSEKVSFYLDGHYIGSKTPLTAGNMSRICFFSTDKRINTTYIDDITVHYEIPQYSERYEEYDIIDSCFVNTLDWLVDVYDPESGGFYTTKSAALTKGYVPSLESTALAIAMLKKGESGICNNVKTDIPVDIRNKLINFFQSRQNPDDGYFYDTGKTGADYNSRDRMRVYEQCVSKLADLGAKPLYPLPGSSSSATVSVKSSVKLMTASVSYPSGFPEEYKTVDGFMSYVTSQNWDSNSWTAGDRTYEAYSYILMLPDEAQTEYRQALLEWLESRQDPITGYWGESGDYGFNALSGAFKVARIYERFNIGIPKPELILQSVIKTVSDGGFPSEAFYVRNPVDLARIVKNYYPEVFKETFNGTENMFVENYSRYIREFIKADGGASSYIYMASQSFGGISSGRQLCESDMDATQQMWLARQYLCSLFGMELDYSQLADSYEGFWDRLRNKEKIEKTQYLLNGGTVSHSFEGISRNDIFDCGFAASVADIELKSEGSNTFLRVGDSSLTESSKLRLVIPEITKTGTIRMKLRYNRANTYSSQVNDASYNYIRLRSGNENFIELVVVDTGSTMTLRTLKQPSTVSTSSYENLGSMKNGVWFTLEINFDKTDTETAVSYKFNGSQCINATNVTTGRYNGSVGAINFESSKPRLSSLSVDDIYITGN
ncbi:MAG: hypothetical protein IJT23_08050 [Clostridia bacterium]|nr:hypothetical protein [Clostridia bacterium]